MRIVKRYASQVLARRAVGESRAQLGVSAAAAPVVCSKCGAVFQGRRWTAVDEIQKGVQPRAARSGLCPACRQIASGLAGGFVFIDGSLLRGHAVEILNILRDEERRATEENPLSRIIKWDKDDQGVLQLKTTTEHLARRLGQALEQAYAGEAASSFSDENKIARVTRCIG
jgi:hypothetical protein